MYPRYYFEYPNMNTRFPFYMKKKRYTNAIPPHRHDFIEFSLVLEGRGSEFINGVEHVMLPGTTVLLLPHQIHHFRSHPDDPLLMFICNFGTELLTEGPEAAWGLRDFILGRDQAQAAFVHLEGENREEGIQIWEKLFKEYERSLPWKPIVLKSLLLEALALFARSGKIAAPEDRSFWDKPASKTAKGIWPIVQYVHEHYLEPLTLETLSKQFGVHPVHISKMFGEQYGLPFAMFLRELRIRHACSLLLTSDMPIAEVAYESGFSSYPTFSRTFLRIKGTTPREYREKRNW
ncbi:AraC family transcriptional regulator [Paenibacillus hamazuiensis]|uniref:AraC family transcriptional regulator n=1 Tax=Paenibacillus hamazuiensis TaxID=2936508 RepID=UPI00200F9463|nr:AraC family transcriptional regulator [Paenibacillus hamazuiensis]